MEIMMNNLYQEIAFEQARKRIKKLKRFYIHLLVYMVVNVMIIYSTYSYSKDSDSIFELRNFTTAFWWGIGLISHGIHVFAIDLFFGKNWEERKIIELMNKEKENDNFV